MLSRSWPVNSDERGQAAILTAGILVFLTMIGLLAANVGVLVATKTAVQRAADSAVLAGCAELSRGQGGIDPGMTDAQNKATLYGQVLNSGSGASQLESGNTVSFPAPPAPPPSPTPSRTFKVEVRRDAPLIGPFALADSSMGATATCLKGEGPRPALHSLGGNMQIDGGADVRMGQTGLLAAGTGPCALTVESGASVRGKFIDTSTGQSCVGGSVDPSVKETPPGYSGDPYGSVPQPEENAFTIDIGPITLTVPPLVGILRDPRPNCRYETDFLPPLTPAQAALLPTSASIPNHCIVDTNTTLEPGVYWGGLELGHPDRATTIQLNPGMYYLAGAPLAGFGGGLFVHSNTTVIGDGVIFYNGRDQWALLGRQACGQVFISVGAQLLTAPPGPGSVYKELLLFQERTCTETAFIEGATVGRANAPGVFYAPAAEVWIKFDNTIHGAVVAGSFVIRNLVIFDAIIPSGTLWHGPLRLIE